MGERFIVMAGTAGAAEALRLAKEDRERLEARFDRSFLKKRDALSEEEERLVSQEILKRTRTLPFCGCSVEFGNKGVFGALWELAKLAGSGLEAELSRIPTDQFAIEVMELADKNIYEEPAGNGFAVITDEPSALLSFLEETGVRHAVIGVLKEGNACVVKTSAGTRFLTPER